MDWGTGVLEWWSNGVLGPELTHYSKTPVLHHSISLSSLSHFHIPTVDAFTRQGAVIDVLGQAEQQLMPPHELRRRLFRDEAHGLTQKFLPFGGIEGLAFGRQQLVKFRI